MKNLEGFSIRSEQTHLDRKDFPGARSWKVTLKNPRGRTLTIPYSMGPALTGEPELEDVLECVISDALCYRGVGSIEEFASEFGYELESRGDLDRLKRAYNACKRYSERLETWLTEEEFEAMAYPED